ncbi:MAG: polysaccharide deacetylase family protein, partial [Planctomycetota bacterium]|nr:polysaccharide deacetylase family protein [Planctomycetota bacterium]
MGLLSAIGRSRSFIIQAAVALLFPRAFLRAWLRCTLPAERIRPGTLYGLTLSFDVENEEDVRALPALCAILREQRWRASFAVIGEYVQRYAPEHRHLAAAGHEIINHTQRHPWHQILSPDRRFDRLALPEMREEIALCHKAIKE